MDVFALLCCATLCCPFLVFASQGEMIWRPPNDIPANSGHFCCLLPIPWSHLVPTVSGHHYGFMSLFDVYYWMGCWYPDNTK